MEKEYYYEYKYLFHLPWLFSSECDECGHKRYYWDKKGFIVIDKVKRETQSFVPVWLIDEVVKNTFNHIKVRNAVGETLKIKRITPSQQ